MKWEYVGQQELPNHKGKPLWIDLGMWRSCVPGGWLILYISAKQVKSSSFYPDPEHIWEINEAKANEAASTLLRSAGQPPLLPEE